MADTHQPPAPPVKMVQDTGGPAADRPDLRQFVGKTKFPDGSEGTAFWDPRNKAVHFSKTREGADGNRRNETIRYGGLDKDAGLNLGESFLNTGDIPDEKAVKALGGTFSGMQCSYRFNAVTYKDKPIPGPSVEDQAYRRMVEEQQARLTGKTLPPVADVPKVVPERIPTGKVVLTGHTTVTPLAEAFRVESHYPGKKGPTLADDILPKTEKFPAQTVDGAILAARQSCDLMR